MEFISNSQGSLYCTFDDEDILACFCMSCDDFLSDKTKIEQLSDIFLFKARRENTLDADEDDEFNVTVYQTGEHEYAMNIEKRMRTIMMNSTDDSLILSESQRMEMANYLEEALRKGTL